MITESLVCALMLPAAISAAGPHPIETTAKPTETVHACWPVDETGQLTGTTITMPIEDGVLAYREIRANAASVGDNRVDFVFVGDGYTAGEMEQYTNDVTNVVANFFQFEPFIAYRNYFRVTQVDVVSSQSGVDHDPYNTFRNTALDMGYWCSDIERLLCVNVSKAYAAANNAGVPDIDQIIALANSSKYGGAGYSGSNLGTAAGQNSSSVQVAIHEIGHSMGDLADEYTYGGSETYTGPEPSTANASVYTASQQTNLQHKWYQWIGTSGDPRFDDPISTYEGANYSSLGIYRPSNNSMMRNLFRQFNQPSAEALIRSIYLEVSPIDSSTDNSLPLTSTDFIFITPMRPIGHALQIRWTIDGQPTPALDGAEFVDLGSLSLAQGDHTVSVTVTDTTDMVRDEIIREWLMTQTKQWTVSNQCSDLADVNGDGFLDSGDIGIFVSMILASDPAADLDEDGFIDSGDIGIFVDAFLYPCD